MNMKWQWVIAGVIAVAAVPSSALAARGVATSDVNMRAGPGTEFPVVTTIPDNAGVNILGCLAARDWCDVVWSGNRGWVSANYLDYFYNNNFVYLPEYYDRIGVPVVTFSFGPYWSQHYAGRPWYNRRHHWANVWRKHDRREVRQERREDRREVRQERRVERRDAQPDRRQDARQERREDRRDVRQDRREQRQNIREGRRDNRRDGVTVRDRQAVGERVRNRAERTVRQNRPAANAVRRNADRGPRMGARSEPRGQQMRPGPSRAQATSTSSAPRQAGGGGMRQGANRPSTTGMAPRGGGGGDDRRR